MCCVFLMGGSLVVVEGLGVAVDEADFGLDDAGVEASDSVVVVASLFSVTSPPAGSSCGGAVGASPSLG